MHLLIFPFSNKLGVKVTISEQFFFLSDVLIKKSNLRGQANLLDINSNLIKFVMQVSLLSKNVNRTAWVSDLILSSF